MMTADEYLAEQYDREIEEFYLEAQEQAHEADWLKLIDLLINIYKTRKTKIYSLTSGAKKNKK